MRSHNSERPTTTEYPRAFAHLTLCLFRSLGEQVFFCMNHLKNPALVPFISLRQ